MWSRDKPDFIFTLKKITAGILNQNLLIYVLVQI